MEERTILCPGDRQKGQFMDLEKFVWTLRLDSVVSGPKYLNREQIVDLQTCREDSVCTWKLVSRTVC